MMSKQIPGPKSDGSPYIPVMTYTTACPIVMIIPNTAIYKENTSVMNNHTMTTQWRMQRKILYCLIGSTDSLYETENDKNFSSPKNINAFTLDTRHTLSRILVHIYILIVQVLYNSLSLSQHRKCYFKWVHCYYHFMLVWHSTYISELHWKVLCPWDYLLHQ